MTTKMKNLQGWQQSEQAINKQADLLNAKLDSLGVEQPLQRYNFGEDHSPSLFAKSCAY